MTLLYADGFEDGATAWNLTSATIGTGRFGNGVSASSISSAASIGFAAASSIVAGFAFRPNGASAHGIVSFQNTNDVHVGLYRSAGGEIVIYRGASPVELTRSAAGVLPASAWSYIEVKTTVHDTAGTVVVRVNGVEVLNATGLDTKDGSSTTIALLRLGVAAQATITGSAWDDVYVCNTSGTVNNDFLGDLTVEHLRPVGDDTAQWAGSDGNSVNNYDLVDEAGTYNGSDYVGSSTVGQRDLYTSSASARATTSPVLAVMPVAVAMKSDVGNRTAKLVVKEGAAGAVRQGAEVGLPTSFGEVYGVFERKNDGTQWTVADVNALRFGIEVTT